MLKRQNANLAHSQSYKGPFKSEHRQILQQPKSMYQILQGTVLLLTISLLGNIFTLIFLCLTSILITKTKYVLFVMTPTGFFNVKRLFKMIIKMHHLELLHFFEVFTFVVNLSNTCICLMMLKSSQFERCLLNFVLETVLVCYNFNAVRLEISLAS